MVAIPSGENGAFYSRGGHYWSFCKYNNLITGQSLQWALRWDMNHEEACLATSLTVHVDVSGPIRVFFRRHEQHDEVVSGSSVR